MKQISKEKEIKESDTYTNTSASITRREWSAELIAAVTLLLVFTAAAILQLSSNDHFSIFFSSTDRFFPKTLYKGRYANECSSIESLVLPPVNLMHNMTDPELLWRASVELKREGYPFERVPKVAFMFLTRASLPFQPLWERFFKGNEDLYSIFVHTVPGYKLVTNKESVFYGRQVLVSIIVVLNMEIIVSECGLIGNPNLPPEDDVSQKSSYLNNTGYPRAESLNGASRSVPPTRINANPGTNPGNKVQSFQPTVQPSYRPPPSYRNHGPS